MYKSRKVLKSEAKAFLKGNWLMAALALLIVFAIILALAAVPIVGPVALIFVAPALSVGTCIYFTSLARNGKVKFGRLFGGFEMLGKSAWLFILINVFTFLWSLLLVIPGIVKAYAYSMAPYILAENPDMTARQALKESVRLTNGHKGRLFVLELSFLGWGILASLPLIPFNSWLNGSVADAVINGTALSLTPIPMYAIISFAAATVVQMFFMVYISAVTANQYINLRDAKIQ